MLCEHTLDRANMGPEVLSKFDSLRPLLPEFDGAISRSGDEKVCLTCHNSMCDNFSVHVAALVQLCRGECMQEFLLVVQFLHEARKGSLGLAMSSCLRY